MQLVPEHDRYSTTTLESLLKKEPINAPPTTLYKPPWLLLVLCSLVSLLLLLTHLLVPATTSTSTTLFIYRDAGESYGLTPLFAALTNDDRTTVVIDHGTNPYWQPMAQEGHHYDKYTLLSALVRPSPTTNTWSDRNSKLSTQAVAQFFQHFPHVDTIVTGLVSNIQTQLLHHAHAHHIRTIGFDDGVGLSAWQNTTTLPAWSAAANLPHMQELWVTATSIRTAVLNSTAYQHLPHTDAPPQIVATGSPALNEWRQELTNPTHQRTANEWLRRVYGGNGNRPWLHIFGGYNSATSNDYGASLDVIARAVATWNKWNTTAVAAPSLSPLPFVSFSSHPGPFPASYEVSLFQRRGVELHVVNHVLASVLAADANVTLSHFSTTGLQSLTVGTPHVYVSVPSLPLWDNIASGLIETICDAAALKEAIEKTQYRFNISRLDDVGIPSNPVARMLNRLERK